MTSVDSHTAGIERVLITGGAGFIGSHLVTRVLGDGCAVRVLEKPGAPTDHLPRERIELASVDIRDAESLVEATRDCDCVLHLAANPNLWARDPGEFEAVNHQGTRNVLAAAWRNDVKRFVHVSTESILTASDSDETITESTRTRLEDMPGPYCRSKWLAEEAARRDASSGRPVVIVSPTVPVGPGDVHMGPLSRMICDFCNGRIKGHLDGDINIVDVRDVADGIWAAALRGRSDQRYLLAGENLTILEFMTLLAELTGLPVPRWTVPYRLALGFAFLEELYCTYLGKKPPMATVTGVRLTRRPFRFDGRRSSEELGLEMRRCRDAVAEAIEEFTELGHVRRP